MKKTSGGTSSIVEITRKEYDSFADYSWDRAKADLLAPLSKKQVRKLTRKGKRDRKSGLIRENVEGDFTSPFIERKKHEFYEADTRLWDDANIQFMDDFSKLRQLLKSISTLEERVHVAKEEKSAYEAAHSSVKLERYRGEEKLPESIVMARRSRHAERRKADLSGQYAAAKNSLQTSLNEISSLHSQLFEADHTLRMTSYTLLHRVEQMVDCYWEGVLRKNPKREALPVDMNLDDVKPRGEILFYEYHDILEEAERVLERYGISVRRIQRKESR